MANFSEFTSVSDSLSPEIGGFSQIKFLDEIIDLTHFDHINPSMCYTSLAIYLLVLCMCKQVSNNPTSTSHQNFDNTVGQNPALILALCVIILFT